MIQIVAFLIKRFANVQACLVGSDLGEILERAGFDDDDIGRTLLFLQLFSDHEVAIAQTVPSHEDSMRVYHPDELDNLSVDVLGFIHFLQAAHIVNAGQREFIIHALMHLPEEEINLDTAKTLALLILWAYRVEVPSLIHDEITAILYGEHTMQ